VDGIRDLPAARKRNCAAQEKSGRSGLRNAFSSQLLHTDAGKQGTKRPWSHSNYGTSGPESKPQRPWITLTVQCIGQWNGSLRGGRAVLLGKSTFGVVAHCFVEETGGDAASPALCLQSRKRMMRMSRLSVSRETLPAQHRGRSRPPMSWLPAGAPPGSGAWPCAAAKAWSNQPRW